MKTLKAPAFAVCVICGKTIKIDENYEFSKKKHGKTVYFHRKCYENMKKGG